MSNPVDMSVTVTAAGRCYKLHMTGHCIFCLERVTPAPSETTPLGSNQRSRRAPPPPLQAKVPPEKVSSPFSGSSSYLFTLNKIWSYVQEEGRWNWNNDGSTEQRSAQFTSLPTICEDCRDDLENICDLMGKLSLAINKLGSLIHDVKYGRTDSGTTEKFKRALKDSSVEEQSVSDTLEFLGIPENDCSAAPAGPCVDSDSSPNVEETCENEEVKLEVVEVKEEQDDDDVEDDDNDDEEAMEPTKPGREKGRQLKRTSRPKQTLEEKREKQRERQRLWRQRQRDSETAEEREQRLQYHRLARQRRKASETPSTRADIMPPDEVSPITKQTNKPSERESRMEKRNLTKNRRDSDSDSREPPKEKRKRRPRPKNGPETAEEKKLRLERDRQEYKERIEKMSLEEKERRRERGVAAQRRREAKETEEERKARLEKRAAAAKEKRRRWTAEEREKQLEMGRLRYAARVAEKEKKRGMAAQRRREAKETEEEREARLEKRAAAAKEKRRRWTAEEREKRLEMGRLRYAARVAEKEKKRRQKIREAERKKRYSQSARGKEKQKFYHKMKRITMTEEEKEEERIKGYFYYQANIEKLGWANLTEEERQRRKEVQRARVKSLSGEKREKYLEGMSRRTRKWQQKRLENLKKFPEKLKDFKKKQYACQKKRRRIDSVNLAKEKLRKKLEEAGVPPEEREVQVTEMEDRMWKKFYPNLAPEDIPKTMMNRGPRPKQRTQQLQQAAAAGKRGEPTK